jgi:hypothetical protein
VETNTCPVDRQLCNVIIVRHYPEGEIIRRIPLRRRRLGNGSEPLRDTGYCEMCGLTDYRDLMNYCHTCTFLYHTECVQSPQECTSVQELHCPICSFEEFAEIADNNYPIRWKTSFICTMMHILDS